MPSTNAAFVPPHCPRTHCPHHDNATGWRWKRCGSYTRQCEPRKIPRFRCCRCRATFSTQTFSTTYYLKRPELLERLFHRLVACSGFRQIARELRCAHSTLMRQASRLGRHSLLFQARLMQAEALATVREPLVIDGFERFAFSQFHPLHIHLVVGAESHFTYALTHSRLRRKGRMTARQMRRRRQIEDRHGRPDPRAIELDMVAALRIAAPRPQRLVLRSDEHPAYPRAIRHLTAHTITHECTPSVQARTFYNPLFPVNRVDMLFTHGGSNFKRETIAFSKTHLGAVLRAVLTQVWCNCCKALSENHDPETPAMKLGLLDTPLSPAAILATRLFPSRVKLPPPLGQYYRGMIDTPGIANTRRHTNKLAF